MSDMFERMTLPPDDWSCQLHIQCHVLVQLAKQSAKRSMLSLKLFIILFSEQVIMLSCQGCHAFQGRLNMYTLLTLSGNNFSANWHSTKCMPCLQAQTVLVGSYVKISNRVDRGIAAYPMMTCVFRCLHQPHQGLSYAACATGWWPWSCQPLKGHANDRSWALH